jgi:hypothetical protein
MTISKFMTAPMVRGAGAIRGPYARSRFPPGSNGGRSSSTAS